MKNIIKSLALLSLLAITILIAKPVQAEPPKPPSGTGTSGNQGPQPTGGPIDGGLGILLALGAGYGAKKLYKARKEKEEKVTE